MTGPATLGYDDVARETATGGGQISHALSAVRFGSGHSVHGDWNSGKFCALVVSDGCKNRNRRKSRVTATVAEVTATVAEVTGRQPNDYRTFAQDKAKLWSSGIGTLS